MQIGNHCEHKGKTNLEIDKQYMNKPFWLTFSILPNFLKISWLNISKWRPKNRNEGDYIHKSLIQQYDTLRIFLLDKIFSHGTEAVNEDTRLNTFGTMKDIGSDI